VNVREPKYVGPRHIQYASSRETLYAVAVDHPNGPWEAIFCKTEEQARWVVALAELREAVRAWDATLSDYCDGPERDRVRAALGETALAREARDE
jgi:hypothetical protein